MSEIKPCPEGELVERLNRLIDARRDFVSKRNAMNAAIPEINATPAERALYDERYNADHEAERALFREASNFATWAAEVNPIASLNRTSDACASVQKERDELREMLLKLRDVTMVEIGNSGSWSLEFDFGDGDENRDEMRQFADNLRAFLARYEGGR